MLSLDELEAGLACVHKNTGLRYTIVEVGTGEVLLEAETAGHEPLTVPAALFETEFALGDRFAGARRRTGRPRRTTVSAMPTGPKSRGRVKKMVRDRGFGFIRGEDGKEVFFHRSGMAGADYDAIHEGDTVEYVIQEGPRGARAENVKTVVAEA